MKMITEKTWAEFRNSGCLWWANRILHIVGWAIVFELDGRKVKRVYPARVRFRGFAGEAESEGFAKLTQHVAKNIKALSKEASE